MQTNCTLLVVLAIALCHYFFFVLTGNTFLPFTLIMIAVTHSSYLLNVVIQWSLSSTNNGISDCGKLCLLCLVVFRCINLHAFHFSFSFILVKSQLQLQFTSSHFCFFIHFHLVCQHCNIDMFCIKTVCLTNNIV